MLRAIKKIEIREKAVSFLETLREFSSLGPTADTNSFKKEILKKWRILSAANPEDERLEIKDMIEKIGITSETIKEPELLFKLKANLKTGINTKIKTLLNQITCIRHKIRKIEEIQHIEEHLKEKATELPY